MNPHPTQSHNELSASPYAPTQFAVQTILILNNKFSDAWRMTSVLEGEYEILAAENIQEMIEILRNKPVDLMLVMTAVPNQPEDSGLQRAAETSRLFGIPFIVITHMPNEVEEIRSLKLGAQDYLNISAAVTVLYARLRNHMALIEEKRMLEHQMFTDGLTGLVNREKFDFRFEEEWRRATRGHHPLSVLLIDIDDFKLYNDQFGHVEGDRCLERVGETLKTITTRHDDVVARYGGEEFGMVLPFSDSEGATEVAKQVCEAIRNLNIQHADGASHPIVTVSVGAATLHPKWNKHSFENAIDLLKQADKQLYAAKDAGRDRYSILSH